ncbi:MAG TPA: S41 family peptidase [Blastocatellia bacterium]|nr:S41 family peptidase [Blastocatellia bacterium]
MKLRNRYWLLVVALVIPVTFAGAHPSQRLSSRDDDEIVTRKKIAEDFASALMTAKEHYAGQIDYDRLTKGSILGMLHTLDPHSNYFDRKEWESFQNEQRSRYSGIGSTIGQRNNGVYIMSPFAGTPAHRGGVRYGDQIVNINGESTEGWNSQQVSNKLLGPEGTPVTVKVSRAGVKDPIEFKFIREAVPLPSITNYYLAGNGVGYINLDRGFNTTTSDEMKEAMRDLQRQGMTSLILDLRNNRGGLVDQAKKISNIFLYRGQKIVSMRGRPTVFPNRDEVAFNNTPEESPVVVLINRGSASAAEIVAGALQDHDRARIVGEASFGKGLVQSVFPLRDGSGLTLTTGHFYTPSGRLIQRDYSGRSFYDYYLRRGDRSSEQPVEEKRTDTGRTVYGGGGIEPDVAVKVPATELALQRAWTEPIFQFVRSLVAGQVPGQPEFRIDRAAVHGHRLTSGEYVITDKVVSSFKAFLRERKDLKADETQVDKDAEWLKRQIRFEVVTAAYGQEVARGALAAGDVQLQRAIGEVPSAKALVEDIRRMRAANRSTDGRRN